MPGFTWQAGLKYTNIKLDYIRNDKLRLFLENNIRGGISSVMGPRYCKSDETTKIIHIDLNNQYGWAMSEPLPTGDFEEFAQFNLQGILEEILNTPDDAEYGYMLDVDLEYPTSLYEKTKYFPFCPEKMKPDESKFSDYMNSIKPKKYKPTAKIICDQTKNILEFIIEC